MAANTSKNLSQAVKSGLRVPVGHIIVSGRWRSTELVVDLQSKNYSAILKEIVDE